MRCPARCLITGTALPGVLFPEGHGGHGIDGDAGHFLDRNEVVTRGVHDLKKYRWQSSWLATGHCSPISIGLNLGSGPIAMLSIEKFCLGPDPSRQEDAIGDAARAL